MVRYIHDISEKAEEKKALAAIKAQIEADKRERASKAAQEKAAREGAAVEAPGPSAPAAAAPAPASVAGRDFKETRLQIRLASGGQPLTTTLPSDASCVLLLFCPSWLSVSLPHPFCHDHLALREVAEFVAGQTLTVDVETVTFTQQFPRCGFLLLLLAFLVHLLPALGSNFPLQIFRGLSAILG
jgi:UBX domain-containing protein 1/4